jgi:hypothetical protein
MRRSAALFAIASVAAGCSKTPPPAPPAPEPAPAPASPTATADAAPATPDPEAVAVPAPAEPPKVFTPVDSPTLADIPAAPLHCKVLGQNYDGPKVAVKYSSSDWSLDVEFAAGQHFVIPLSEALEAPGAGYTRVTAKACCPGYLHRAEPGKAPVSLNAPNGVAVEITAWDVADWKPDGGMTQPGGTISGRLAVAYDADNWAAGTFTTEFEYFGEPPVARAARAAAEKEAAAAAVGDWTDLPAPAGVSLAPGQKVWAAAVAGDRWSFGQQKIASVEGAVVALEGDRFTTVGLVRPMTPATDVKKGAFVAAVDHLGPQYARVDSVGDKVGVTYLSPASKPRDNQLAPDRLYPLAMTAADPGMPPYVFFDQDGRRASGEAVAVVGDQTVVVLYGGKGIVRVPSAGVVAAGPARPLKKRAKVEAVVGCGMSNSWIPRPGKVTDVLGGGVGYVVDTEPCKGVSVTAARVRPL